MRTPSSGHRDDAISLAVHVAIMFLPFHTASGIVQLFPPLSGKGYKKTSGRRI